MDLKEEVKILWKGWHLQMNEDDNAEEAMDKADFLFEMHRDMALEDSNEK